MKILSKFRIPKTKEEKKKLRKERFLLILSGLLIGISFPPFIFPFTLLIFIGFVPYLYVLMQRKTLAEINRATFLMAFILTVITVYWVGSWQAEADPFLMMGGAALLFALPCVMLIPSTLFYLSKKLFNGKASLLGAFGLSVVVLFINIFFYKSFINIHQEKSFSTRYFVIATFIFVLFVVYGLVKISSFKFSGKELRIGVVQPNIDPWAKWQSGNLQEMVNNYLEQSQEVVDEGAKLILWPETALPVYLMNGNYYPEVNSIYAYLDSNNIALLTGMPQINFYFDDQKFPADAKYNKGGRFHYTTYNSILLLRPGTREYQQYGKMKLVPLGEHVPFVEEFSFLADVFKWGVGLSGWNVGKDTLVFKLPMNKDTVKIGGLVCYESIFPLFVTNFVKRGAQFIVVVTNDSWYGNSSGPYQHEDFAILRAVENRRSVVRCANGGISCIINPLGKIESETKMFTKTVLVGDVELRSEKTFYTEHPAIITTIISIISLWIVGLNILLYIKNKFKL
ncbi:MAG: apolipoprotein N-acyltransferase [Ignavibacteriaceae bacterium]